MLTIRMRKPLVTRKVHQPDRELKVHSEKDRLMKISIYLTDDNGEFDEGALCFKGKN